MPIRSAVRWKINRLLQVIADRELGRAISAGEQARTHYYGILRQFISSKPDSPKEIRCQTGNRLDAGGLKEIDTAWNNLDDTEKKLRNAYMKLYAAYL
jgi:hypothetical protein